MKSFTWLAIILMVPMFAFSSLIVAAGADVAHEDVLHVNPALSLRDVLNATIKRQPQQAQLQS